MNKILSLMLLLPFVCVADMKAPVAPKAVEPAVAAKVDAKAAPKKDPKAQEKAVAKGVVKNSILASENSKGMKPAIENLAAQLDISDKAGAFYKDFMEAYEEEVLAELVDLYVKEMTLDELKKLDEWFKTPVAKKVNSISQDVSNVVMGASQKAMMKAIKPHEEEIQKRAQAKQAKAAQPASAA